jgi:tRNA(Ile)-lysidine synthase
MTSLAGRVMATLQRRRLCDAGARVIAAVSGGADSVALAHLLMELSAGGRLQLVGIAHLDHRLRGAESDRDAAFCAALSQNLRVPFDVEQISVSEQAVRTGRSIEDAARQVRYAFLERARVRLGADMIAVGHTRDDQAETVLLRLLRGAGIEGLGAIRPRRQHVIRPLIDLRHAALVRYLEARGLPWVEDSSNADLQFLRNRVRHELLPWLRAHVSPAVVNLLARTSDLARDDEALLTALAAERFAAVRQGDAAGGRVELDAAGLAEEPPAIARRIVRQALREVASKAPSFAHVGAVLRLVEGGRPGSVTLPGCHAKLSPGRGVLSIGDVPAESAPGGWTHPLPVPGSIELPEARGRMHASTVPQRDGADMSGRGASVMVPAALVPPGLLVRCWAPGDRLRPLGLSGRKKVQDLFVDRKVPYAERHRVPVVTLPDGRIIWVAGHALSEEFRVTTATSAVVVLNFEPFGGR